MRYLTIGLIIAAILILMCGCNTIASIGDLTQSVGKDIKVVAEGTQRRMMEE